MKECIFHFKVMRGGETKEIRGMVMLPDNKQPSIQEFIECFDGMGYHVTLENERELIFSSLPGEAPYKLDITKIEIKGMTEEPAAHDGELKAILQHITSINK